MTPRIGLILLTALLMQCGNPVETPLPGAETIPARLQETTHFNGGNAMFHAARMTEMGDRGSGTPGYRQQLDYLKKELAKHGWTCQEQSFEQETSKGRFYSTGHYAAVRHIFADAYFNTALKFNNSILICKNCFIYTLEVLTFTNCARSLLCQVVDTQYHIL